MTNTGHGNIATGGLSGDNTPVYDAIGSKYQILIDGIPTGHIQTHNLELVLRPLLKDGRTRVMDLACGTGYYSRKLIDRGASYVLGVDLSPEMIRICKAHSQSHLITTSQPHRLEFTIGDARSLGATQPPPAPAPDTPNPEQGQFDIILGGWLLNYASCTAEMTSMYRTISSNLRPGGEFIAITPAPFTRAEMDAFAARWNALEREFPARWGVTYDFFERLDSAEGWRCRVGVFKAGAVEDDGEDVSWDQFNLSREVYEEAAGLGGMVGRFEWRGLEIPPGVGG